METCGCHDVYMKPQDNVKTNGKLTVTLLKVSSLIISIQIYVAAPTSFQYSGFSYLNVNISQT